MGFCDIVSDAWYSTRAGCLHCGRQMYRPAESHRAHMQIVFGHQRRTTRSPSLNLCIKHCYPHRVQLGSGWLSHTYNKRAPMDMNELCPKKGEDEHWSSYRHVCLAYDDHPGSNELGVSQRPGVLGSTASILPVQ